MRVVDQGAGGSAGPDVRRGQRVRGEFSEVGRRWKGLSGMFYEDFSFLALGESAWWELTPFTPLAKKKKKERSKMWKSRQAFKLCTVLSFEKLKNKRHLIVYFKEQLWWSHCVNESCVQIVLFYSEHSGQFSTTIPFIVHKHCPRYFTTEQFHSPSWAECKHLWWWHWKWVVEG